MKKWIAFIMALICVFSFVSCSNNEVKVWDWAQSLDQEDLVSVTPWSQDKINQDDVFKPLNDKEIKIFRELAKYFVKIRNDDAYKENLNSLFVLFRQLNS